MIAGSFVVRVDALSRTPASEQLRVQVLGAVQRGDLVAGAQLPPVRQLADELHLAPNTVAKVYRELERDEVVVTRGRNGTSIAPTGVGPERQAQLAALEYAGRVRELGIHSARALEIVAEALGEPSA
ncbi:GntR family transcriptional regulator [Subtercola lobariae]|uniref:GntR family transcriptional regulator n=1 Tax=Subtercola lobariae TaxID=1588641 RepID=A0A917BEL4_9MICO|nr:GntR family transcriptional regulator [Subtercola lobariae]